MMWLKREVQVHRLAVWMTAGLMWGVLGGLMLLVGRGVVPPSRLAEVYWIGAAGAMATGWLVAVCMWKQQVRRQAGVIAVQRASLAELSELVAQGIERGRSR